MLGCGLWLAVVLSVCFTSQCTFFFRCIPEHGVKFYWAFLGTTKVVVNMSFSWELLKTGCSPSNLTHQHYCRIIYTSLSDLATVKSLLLSAEREVTVVNTDLSFSRSQSCNTHFILFTGEAAEWHNTKTSMNLQQPAPLIPPVHPDVQMKPLPFYDVLDVLIKPSSLGLWCFFVLV